MDKDKKRNRYQRIYSQLKELLEPHDNIIANMSTIVAVLHHKFDYYFWTGFYILQEGDLIVGPYQGPVACIKLEKDTGVCWAAINKMESIVVPDVHKFPGHIACDSRSNSEIVVPVKDSNGKIKGVLDVDSKDFESFNKVDKEELERIVDLLNKKKV